MSSEAAAAAAATTASMEVGVVDFPSGYRFIPADLELIRDYLCKKITNQKLPSDVPVVDYDIYATEPWNLPVNNKIDTISSNRSYYFVKLFDGIDRRQHKRLVNPSCDGHGVIVAGGGGKRRGGGGGCWKRIAGGRDTRYIRDESYRPIGVKKSFAFHAYVCSPPHSNNNTTISDDDANNNNGNTTTPIPTIWKTNWIMDEYSITSQRSQPWTLCTIRKNDGGGEEEDDEVQLLSLQQVQQLEEKVHQSVNDLPYRELEILEKIKTIKKKIKANQIQIWDDQHELRKLNEVRIFTRKIKHMENMRRKLIKDDEIHTQIRERKLTMSEADELVKQRREAAERQRAAVKVEAAAIRAESYYQVPLPSRFKRIRISNNFH